MAVRVSNVIDPTLIFEFTCSQWGMMTAASKADWTVTENTCGVQTTVGNPYAASDFLFTLNGVVGSEDPITISVVDGVYTIGISPATGTSHGSMSALDYLKAQTYLEPVSKNTIAVAIPAGAVTAVTVTDALLADEYAVGDVFSVTNNTNGERVKLTVTANTTGGSFTISATGTAADEIPIGGILVPIYSIRQFLTEGTGIDITGGVISNTAPDQVVSLTDGTGIDVTGTYPNFTITNTAPDQTVVLTEGANITITGTYPNFTIAATGGGGLSDGDYGDITVSGGGTVMNIDAGVVGTTEIADLNVTTGKLADSAVTTAKIADLNVTTGKLADDAVTFAKMQNIGTDKLLGRDNAGSGDIGEIGLGASLEFDSGGNIQRAALTGDVTAVVNSNTLTIADNAVNNFKLADMAANTIKGNNTGGAADPKDLTVAQVQTLLGFLNATGAGLTSPRIPFANDANTLQDEVNLRWLTGTQEVIIGGDVSLDARFSHNSTANITGTSNLLVGDNNVSGDYIILLKNTRNASNTGRSVIISEVGGASAGDAFYVARIAAGQNWAWGLDNSDGDKFKITSSTAPGNVANSGLIITPAAVALVGINKDAPAHPLDVSGRAMATEFINTNNAPTVDTIGNGMGVGGAINVVAGGNNGFYISFTTGTTPVNNGDLFRVVYQTPYPASSFPVFCQGDINSANNLSKFYYSAIAGASFNMKANGTLPASTNFILFFNVFGR